MFEFVLKPSQSIGDHLLWPCPWRVVDNFVRHTLKLNIYYNIAYVYIYIYIYVHHLVFIFKSYFIWFHLYCWGCFSIAPSHSVSSKALQAAQGNFDVSGACELHRPWTASKRCLSDAAGDTAGPAELRAAPVIAKPGVGGRAAVLAAGGRCGDFHGTPIAETLKNPLVN